MGGKSRTTQKGRQRLYKTGVRTVQQQLGQRAQQKRRRRREETEEKEKEEDQIENTDRGL